MCFQVKVMCKLQEVLLIIALIYVQLVDANPVTARANVSSTGNLSLVEELPISSSLVAERFLVPSKSQKTTTIKPEQPIQKPTTKATKTTTIRGTKHEKSGLISESDKDDFMEKAGNTNELGYLRNFHKKGAGGYDHYEAYHNKANAVYEHEDLESVGKEDEAAVSGHNEETKKSEVVEHGDYDEEEEKSAEDEEGETQEKKIKKNVSSLQEAKRKNEAPSPPKPSYRPKPRPKDKSGDQIASEPANFIKALPTESTSNSSDESGADLPLQKYKTCKRKHLKFSSPSNGNSDGVESQSNGESPKTSGSEHKMYEKPKAKRYSKEQTTTKKYEIQPNSSGYEVHENPDEGYKNPNKLHQHQNLNSYHTYPEYESESETEDTIEQQHSPKESVEQNENEYKYNNLYPRFYHPYHQQQYEHKQQLKLKQHLLPSLHRNHPPPTQSSNLRHGYNGYEAFIVHEENAVETGYKEDGYKDKRPGQRSSVINYHYPARGISYNEKSGKEKNYEESSDYNDNRNEKGYTNENNKKNSHAVEDTETDTSPGPRTADYHDGGKSDNGNVVQSKEKTKDDNDYDDNGSPYDEQRNFNYEDNTDGSNEDADDYTNDPDSEDDTGNNDGDATTPNNTKNDESSQDAEQTEEPDKDLLLKTSPQIYSNDYNSDENSDAHDEKQEEDVDQQQHPEEEEEDEEEDEAEEQEDIDGNSDDDENSNAKHSENLPSLFDGGENNYYDEGNDDEEKENYDDDDDQVKIEDEDDDQTGRKKLFYDYSTKLDDSDSDYE